MKIALGRHPWRPSHMHFMFEKKGFDHLITCVFPTFILTPISHPSSPHVTSFPSSSETHSSPAPSTSAATPTKLATPFSASKNL